MSGRKIWTKQGAYGRWWGIQLFDEYGNPVDLTNGTNVRFSMWERSGSPTIISDKPGIVANGSYALPDGSVQAFTPTDGVLLYQPSSADGDADTVGFYRAVFSYDLPTGKVVDPGSGYLEITIEKAG